jgi:hypothetical protein
MDVLAFYARKIKDSPAMHVLLFPVLGRLAIGRHFLSGNVCLFLDNFHLKSLHFRFQKIAFFGNDPIFLREMANFFCFFLDDPLKNDSFQPKN